MKDLKGDPSKRQPQPVVAPLTRAAIFLVVTVNPGDDYRATVRAFCEDFPALVRAVAFRDLEGYLSCVIGFGSSAWDRLFGAARPATPPTSATRTRASPAGAM